MKSKILLTLLMALLANTYSLIAASIEATMSAPTVTAVSPDKGCVGFAYNVTITGTNFSAPVTVTVSNVKVAVSNATFGNDTTVTATFTIDPLAAGGKMDVTVNGATGKNLFKVQVPSDIKATPPVNGSGNILPNDDNDGTARFTFQVLDQSSIPIAQQGIAAWESLTALAKFYRFNGTALPPPSQYGGPGIVNSGSVTDANGGFVDPFVGLNAQAMFAEAVAHNVMELRSVSTNNHEYYARVPNSNHNFTLGRFKQTITQQVKIIAVNTFHVLYVSSSQTKVQ